MKQFFCPFPLLFVVRVKKALGGGKWNGDDFFYYLRAFGRGAGI